MNDRARSLIALRIRGVLLALSACLVTTPAAAKDDPSLQAIATARLDALRGELRAAQDLDVMVSASVHADDGSLTAPPRRSSFAFSRPGDDVPFRFSIHSWSGPGGGSDLVCDGTGLVVGDPLLRRYELRPAPAAPGDVLADGDLAPRLGLGPAFVLAALGTGILDDLIVTDDITPCTVAGGQALAVRCRTSDAPDAPALELTIPRDGAAILHGVTMPVDEKHTVALVFTDWKRNAGADRADRGNRFSMTPPPSWERTDSLRAGASDEASRAPIHALVGRRAPRLTMRNADGDAVDPFTDMVVPVAILFTGDDALNDRAARDFASVIGTETRIRGYRVQVVDDASNGPGLDRDLAVEAARCAAAWRLSGLPTLVIVTPDGRIRAAQVGHPGRDVWAARLDPLLDRLATVPTAAD
ncbi:MAG: hypothetical protein CMJ54_11475 [Planctomycetaceae bacterium]|nr:hypothetical protein [Planctomycetaceae bacterium]